MTSRDNAMLTRNVAAVSTAGRISFFHEPSLH